MQHTKQKPIIIEDAKFEEIETASGASPAVVNEAAQPAPKSRVVRSMRVVVDKVPSVRIVDAVELVMLCAYMAAKVVALLALWLLMLVFKILGVLLSVVENRLPWSAAPDDDYQEAKGSPSITVINNTNIHVGGNDVS